MKIATLVKDFGSSRNTTGAEQKFYRLSEPITDYDGNKVDYVVVSAVIAMDHGGPETFIFSANKRGTITNFSELDGSARGDLNHEAALERAGYTIAN